MINLIAILIIIIELLIWHIGVLYNKIEKLKDKIKKEEKNGNYNI